MFLDFLKSRSKKTVLGLDIGSKNTKIMGLKQDKTDLTVSYFSMTPTPPDVFSKGKVQDSSKLSDFITDQILALEISNQVELILGISGKGVIAKKIDIPEMEDYMIPEYVEIEAEQELFYNKEEMYLDYQILENLNSDKPDTKSLFVMTVLKQIIDGYTESVPDEIAFCNIVDTNFSSLYNIFEHNSNLNPESIYMLIDSGCSMTNVIIIIKNQIVFARNILFGGDFFTNGIQKKMSVDYSAAEDLKITASQGEKAPVDVVDLLKGEFCHAFAEELVSCYELYLSFYPDKTLNEIYMTGGNSQTLGLKEAIEDKFNLSVKPLKAFKNIKSSSDFSKQGSSSFYSIVAGLALRGVK